MRWDHLKLDDHQETHALPGLRDPAVVRRFDAPEALDMRFYEIHAKSVLNRVPGRSAMPFGWTVNPYRGCSHACKYCFARPTHEYLDFGAGRDFEREIVVKVNAPERLRADLARRARTPAAAEEVALGTNTDPYQWVESRYRLMPGIWEALRDARVPASVLTKSPLLLRDLDLMLQLRDAGGFEAALSVPSLDEAAWRATEPHTPHPRTRLAAVAELNRVGIPTAVLAAPLMPGINDDPAQIEALLAACSAAGAVAVRGIGLHLRGSTRQVFLDWLRDARPDLVDRYEELYRHGPYLPKAESLRLTRSISEDERSGPRSWSPVARARFGGTAARPRGGSRPDGGPRRPGSRRRDVQQSLF
ncbi:radical SAM protein [Patulibacter defluvii]|uniref:radical SAM protein n=1 Tax=Patulibacter defluvii TaxID=3095358 RepID=UPI002A74D07D|nr:radical SAM protein [Patulibacter sp. DM4]